MRSKYFEEMMHAINADLQYREGATTVSNLVLAMSYKTYMKLVSVYSSYILHTKNENEQWGILFGVRIQIDPDIEDGHVCVLERKFEYMPTMENWWEN